LGYTIYDIARLANVSKSTVSRVLNNQTNISPEARERVMKAVEQLNYHPSKLARSLSTGFDAIMVMSRSARTTADNPFFADILQTISEKAEEENFDVILQTAKNSADELEKCISKIKEKMIKGIIMLSSPANEDICKQLDLFQIPIVVIGKVEGQYQNIYSVDTDNYQNSYDLTKHLINQGHKEIACLHAPLGYHVSVDRLEGYKACMKDHGLSCKKDWNLDSGYTIETGMMTAKKLLSASQKPTAVFATDDMKVLSVYKAAAELSISIPKDLSIVGYINSQYGLFLSPTLTSFEIPVRKLGEAGVSILFSKIKNQEEPPARTIIKTKEVIRESVLKRN